jgi:branched-chain amino acid transport system substrate-binding protein
MITAQSPIRSFLRGRDQWTSVWAVFFDEQDMVRQQFLTMNMVASNRKVALFTEHAPDGITMGNLWKTYAPEFGYEVVYHATFPVGTSEFGDLIRRAQERQAEIVISVAWLNETIALWRQMRTLGYKPKAAFLEKGAEPVEWWRANGQAAHGTCMVGYWHPALGYPGAQELRQRFEQDTGLPYSQAVATTYAISQILLDAIARAGSLAPRAINAAIAETDKTFVVGPVKFKQGKDGNVSVLPTFMMQWQDGETRIVYPPQLANADFLYPLP